MKGHQLVLKAREAVVLATEGNQFFHFTSWDTEYFRRVFSPFFFFSNELKKYFEKPHVLGAERCRLPGSGGLRQKHGGLLPSLGCSMTGTGALLSASRHREMTPLLGCFLRFGEKKRQEGICRKREKKRKREPSACRAWEREAERQIWEGWEMDLASFSLHGSEAGKAAAKSLPHDPKG